METTKHVRPSWDEYFIKVSQVVSERGTCDRGYSGAVIVRDKRILSTGYVGSPPGLEHCDDIGHLMMKILDEKGEPHQHCIRTSHAEQNAICQAARNGVNLQGATLYCKMEPCQMCAKMVLSAGIMRVVCEKRYHGAGMTRDMFMKAGVEMDVLNDELETYANMK